MLRWYRDVFDARIQFANSILAFLTYDDEHHRFAFANMSAIEPEGTDRDHVGEIGVDHVAYAYRSLRDLLENWEHLSGINIKPYWCLHHGITVSLYYRDPDGNQIECQVDCYPTNEEANAFMAGDAYAKNPIGVEFDPASWLAQLRRGIPETHFLIRTIHEPVPRLQGHASSNEGGAL